MFASMLVITKSDNYLRQRLHFSSILQSCDCVWQCESVFVTRHTFVVLILLLWNIKFGKIAHTAGGGDTLHTHQTEQWPLVITPGQCSLRHIGFWDSEHICAWAGRIFTTVFAPQQMTKTEISIIDSIKTFEISSKIIKYPDLAFSPADKSHFTHLTLRPPWPY